MRNKKPLFEHDCDVCEFIATMRDESGKDMDMYVHASPDEERGVFLNFVNRYGDDGPDYLSWTERVKYV